MNALTPNTRLVLVGTGSNGKSTFVKSIADTNPRIGYATNIIEKKGGDCTGYDCVIFNEGELTKKFNFRTMPPIAIVYITNIDVYHDDVPDAIITKIFMEKRFG
jgi:GTPase SAR1 family protein